MSRYDATSGHPHAALRRVVVGVTLLAVGACSPGGGSGSPPDGIPADSQRAVVVRVVDGDTVVLRGEGDGVVAADDARVRLLEIDAPESVAPDRPVECFGPQAAAELAELLPAGSRVWAQPDEELTDDYDRLLLYLWTDDGEFVNLEMVREGFAAVVLYAPNDRYIEPVHRAEDEARAEERGMWGAC